MVMVTVTVTVTVMTEQLLKSGTAQRYGRSHYQRSAMPPTQHSAAFSYNHSDSGSIESHGVLHPQPLLSTKSSESNTAQNTPENGVNRSWEYGPRLKRYFIFLSKNKDYGSNPIGADY